MGVCIQVWELISFDLRVGANMCAPRFPCQLKVLRMPSIFLVQPVALCLFTPAGYGTMWWWIYHRPSKK